MKSGSLGGISGSRVDNNWGSGLWDVLYLVDHLIYPCLGQNPVVYFPKNSRRALPDLPDRFLDFVTFPLVMPIPKTVGSFEETPISEPSELALATCMVGYDPSCPYFASSGSMISVGIGSAFSI